jgi:hypothetical protein
MSPAEPDTSVEAHVGTELAIVFALEFNTHYFQPAKNQSHTLLHHIMK